MHNCYCKHERFFKQMMGVFVRAVLAVTQKTFMELILIQIELPLGSHCKNKAFFLNLHYITLAIFSNECPD